jgi:hypothetical protein
MEYSKIFINILPQKNWFGRNNFWKFQQFWNNIISVELAKVLGYRILKVCQDVQDVFLATRDIYVQWYKFIRCVRWNGGRCFVTSSFILPLVNLGKTL